MINDQSVNIQTLQVSIGLSIFQELQQELGGFLGPTSLGSTPLLSLETHNSN